MNIDSAKTKLAGAVAWARRQPAHILYPGALLTVIFLIAVIAARRSHHAATSETQPAQAAAAAVQPSKASQDDPSHSTRPPVASIRGLSPRPAEPVAAVPMTVSPIPVPAAITPPSGLHAGFARVAVLQQDQFSKWVQVSSDLQSAQTTSFRTAGGSSNSMREEWTAWVNLAKPATLVELAVGGDGGGEVAAEIDGVSLGPSITHYSQGIGRSIVASIPLAAGWHQVAITVTQQPRAQPIAARVALGDGAAPPAPVTPWSATPSAPPAASAEPHVTKDVPAAASSIGVRGDSLGSESHE